MGWASVSGSHKSSENSICPSCRAPVGTGAAQTGSLRICVRDTVCTNFKNRHVYYIVIGVYATQYILLRLHYSSKKV